MEASLSTSYRISVNLNLSNGIDRHLFEYIQKAALTKGQSNRNSGISNLIKLLAIKGLALEQAETGVALVSVINAVKGARKNIQKVDDEEASSTSDFPAGVGKTVSQPDPSTPGVLNNNEPPVAEKVVSEENTPSGDKPKIMSADDFMAF